jgi:hypothetical protein
MFFLVNHGKSTSYMAMFNSYVELPEGKSFRIGWESLRILFLNMKQLVHAIVDFPSMIKLDQPRPPSRGFMLASLHVGRKVQFEKELEETYMGHFMGINLYHQIARNKFCANMCKPLLS